MYKSNNILCQTPIFWYIFNCFSVEILLVLGSFTDVPRDNCSSLLELLGSMKKKMVNINNNVGYDLKMKKYNPICLNRIGILT